MALTASRRPWLRGRVVSSETGMATVWGAGAVLLLVALAGVVWMFGAVLVAKHRAVGAADLAALAAAGQVESGVEVACGRARDLAARMGTSVVECFFDGRDALVVTESPLPGLPLPVAAATARARAGPVTE